MRPGEPCRVRDHIVSATKQALHQEPHSNAFSPEPKEGDRPQPSNQVMHKQCCVHCGILHSQQEE